MQGQRQQVALQFGVNVSSIERLVHRLRDTGRVVDRPQRGRQHIYQNFNLKKKNHIIILWE
jgi:transposase